VRVALLVLALVGWLVVVIAITPVSLAMSR
jgi:hypothetical protein